jgi:hypothetical protein
VILAAAGTYSSEKKNMKNGFGFLALLMIVCAVFVGCSGNDKDRATASSGSVPSSPNTAQGAAGAGMRTVDEAAQVDPSSSGGSTLATSTPYTDGKGAAVSQNVNPAPFLTANEAGATTARGGASTGLVSRADGTMYGPSDQPAAGVGPGMENASTGSAGMGANRSRGKATAGALSATTKPSADQSSGK